MNHNSNNVTSGGKITSGISCNLLSTQTINFIYNNLASWRDDPHRPNESTEDKLNLQLCKYLDSKARNDFPMVRFNREEYQTGQRRVDISASPAKELFIGVTLHTIYDPFLVLECKRLPAPSPDREKEYVTGGKNKISGGIQRFKLCEHGRKLDVAVIIAYIQYNSVRYWHHKINEWISELSKDASADCCSWFENETLGIIEENSVMAISKYKSRHSRKYNNSDMKDVELNHLWVIL